MTSEGRRHWLARRVAQGIGARPLAWRLAQKAGLSGWIRNTGNGLEVALWGPEEGLLTFEREWNMGFPLPPAPVLEALPAEVASGQGLVIRASENAGAKSYPLAPDLGICAACIRELHDSANRRFHDPFLGCSHCGPRLSLVWRLPYDRRHTAWRGLPICNECRREFEDSGDRRFHSQNICCPDCGPSWRLDKKTGVAMEGLPLEDVLAWLASGEVLAAQSTGGHHYLGLAGRRETVASIRRLKHRPVQPLAVLVPDLAMAQRLAHLSCEEITVLAGPRRPVLLCGGLTAEGRALAALVAPEHPQRLGLMLPVTALQSLLAGGVQAPLVCTSANLHGEPIPLTCDELPPAGEIPLWTLTHSLPLNRAVDDSVVQVTSCGLQVLRRARGFAPEPLPLPYALSKPSLALGGDLQNTVAVGLGDEAFLSAHLGGQQSPNARARAREWLNHVLAHLGVTPQRVMVDAHPGYHVRALASEFADAEVREVFHHRAHAAHVLAEHSDVSGSVLCAIFDGTGYGEDHSAWGGELFLGPPENACYLRRVGSIFPLPLPGAAAAIKQPWRILDALEEADRHPLARSVGRLFDAAAVALGLGRENTFEGDLPARVMNAALMYKVGEATPLPVECLEQHGVWELDTLTLLRRLILRREQGEPVPTLAFAFHEALVNFVLQAVEKFQAKSLALGGGCFANVLLNELLQARSPVPVFMPRLAPPGDGGLAYGQLACAAAMDAEGRGL